MISFFAREITEFLRYFEIRHSAGMNILDVTVRLDKLTTSASFECWCLFIASRLAEKNIRGKVLLIMFSRRCWVMFILTWALFVELLSKSNQEWMRLYGLFREIQTFMFGFKITLERNFRRLQVQKRILQQELICEDNFHQVETTC